MYRRYSQTGDGSMPLSQVNKNRVKNVIIILLLIAMAVLLFFSLPLFSSRQETRSTYIQRIQSECDEAVRQSASLSRNAGADSAAMLARIRCCISSIRTVNSLSGSLGGTLMEDERLLTIQNTVDRFLSFLTTGMDTGEYATTLQNALTELQATAATLQ